MTLINRTFAVLLLGSAGTLGAIGNPLSAQPANGAPAAFERVRDVMQARFKGVELTRDPDADFANLLVASYEEMISLARTQLEYGADRQLRAMAQQISEEQQKQIDEIKQWQVRRRQSDARGQPDRTSAGGGPLERQAQMQHMHDEGHKQAAPAPGAASTLPMVKGTVEGLDVANGKITLDHGAIPNLNMEGMTMPWRVQDPAMISTLKKGDKVQFSADRVNGSLMITKITKAK